MKYRLKELRQANGLLQSDVAEKLKMTRNNYCRIENEQVALFFDDAIKLAELFDVAIEELCEGYQLNKALSNEEAMLLRKTASVLLQISERFSQKKTKEY